MKLLIVSLINLTLMVSQSSASGVTFLFPEVRCEGSMGSFHMNTFASTCMTGLSERSIRIPPGVGGEDNACIYYWDGGDGPGGDDGCPACANFAMKVKPGHCHLLPGKEGRWAILHGDKGAPCEARKAICKGKPRFNPWDDKKWADNEIALNIKESLVTPRKRRMDDVSPAE